jgi:6-phosphogluconolactonase (cycloisomerase 2 family)
MGSSLSTFDISKPSTLAPVQSETFTMEGRGPVRYRQDSPHPHEAALDPTGRFVVVPDLGADLVRVFAVDKATLKLEVAAPLVAPKGSGPRHLAFMVAGDKTFLFLISELANTITTYEVAYAEKALSFKSVYNVSTYGEGKTVGTGVTAAEIVLSVRFHHLMCLFLGFHLLPA